MKPLYILYPIFPLVALTFYITIRMARLRVRAVLQDGLKASYFKNNRGAEPPEYMLRTDQHYINLLEQPVLFYVACLLAYVTTSVDMLLISLAWLFVASRLVHTVIHLGSNKILKRRKAFIVSMFILISLWCVLLVKLLQVPIN